VYTSGSEWLQRALGYRCRDEALIEAALTHRSAVKTYNNERLEFLGDSVLNFIVADMLYRAQPKADEGELSRLRATLVKGQTLAEVATSLGLGDHLKLGSGERRAGGFRRESILADALEAVLGAVYLDGGFQAAQEVIERVFEPLLARLPEAAELKDPKTRLQEYLQGKGLALPVYRVVKIDGEAHLQSFTVSCAVKGLGLEETGEGLNRRKAEQEAAAKMMVRLVEKIEDA
jgi:ribonuclease-3